MASNSRSGAVPETDEVRTARKVVELTQRVERLGGWTFREQPRIEKVPLSKKCSELETIGGEGRMATSSRPGSGDLDRIWRTIGLISDTDASAWRERFDCVATKALYQTREKRILLFMDPKAEIPEQGFAHELVHALQDQRRDLRHLFDSIREPDARQGLLGALEGEAEFISFRIGDGSSKEQACRQPTQGDLPLLEQKLRSVPELSKLPLGISLPAYAPYVFGERLACELHQRFGTAGLDTLLARPPNGSWQLWNTQAYLRNLSPTDWDTGWNGMPKLPPGWNPVGHVRVGESRIAALLLAWDRLEAVKLLGGTGMGWRGDRAWVASNGADHAVFWRLAFESPRKAKDFARVWWSTRESRLGRKMSSWYEHPNYAAWKDSAGISYQTIVTGSEVGIGEGFDGSRTAKMLAKCMRLAVVSGEDRNRQKAGNKAAKWKPSRPATETQGRQSRRPMGSGDRANDRI